MNKNRDKLVTEEKILKASLEEFGEFGYSGARVDRIAERAGVNKAMIYYYFENKEVLYERVIRENTAMIFNRLSGVVSISDDPVVVLRSLLDNYITLVDSLDRNVVKTMLRELASGGDFFRKIAIPTLVLPMVQLIESLFGRGAGSGQFKSLDPYYTFIQLVGGILFFNMVRMPMQGTFLEEKLFSGNYLESFRENYLTIVLHGLLEREG